MEKLKKLSERKVSNTPEHFKRFLYYKTDWKQSLIIILGQRGTGKTTLLLQRLKQTEVKGIYLSLDDIYFEANRLINLIDLLYEEGYRAFYLDEVHRYKHWSKDLKNAYDNYPDIHLVATGSSVLEVSQGKADLSRRAAIHHLPGLSFREFLSLEHGITFNTLELSTLLKTHQDIAAGYQDQINIERAFHHYLQYGYYPFFKEGKNVYSQKLEAVINLVLELDIAAAEELNYATIRNIKKLMYVISQSVPFHPNISKLADKLEASRNSVLKMLDMLDRADVLFLLRSSTHGISYLQKPERIYLQNPGLLHIYSDQKPEKGNLRETFFLNQLGVNHNVTASKWADFMVDDTYTFEIGGPTKTHEQIKGIPASYIAADGIKGGTGNKIPLWLFGFLY